MTGEVTIHLQRDFFGEKERVLAACGGLSAIAFRYDSGVCGLRLENERGYLTMLPFQGQQIWDVAFDGRVLTMRSMFREPRPTQVYLETYGGFLIHCGATAMGCPGEKDMHPLHGELPNAPYQKAWLAIGEDERGAYIGLSGEYQHTVAFNTNYVARPEVRLYAGSTRIPISMAIENLKRTEMELMYLAHVNFRPVDHGRLVYSAPCTPEHVRVRTSIPAHIHPPEGYVEFLQELEEHPERHNVLVPGLAFDPEVVFSIDYLADEEGWAHSMQVHPDGSADFISHRPDQLDHGIRWICRTPDQDALGLCLPATAEVEGYHAEKAKGNIRVLPAGGSVRFDIEAGTLMPEEAQELEARIEGILEVGGGRQGGDHPPTGRSDGLRSALRWRYRMRNTGCGIQVREARLSDKAAVANLLGQLAETIEDWPFERDRLSRGVGRRLVEEAIQVARARGACELEVSTEKTNRAAQAFYRRLGFSHEAVLMELELEGEE